MKNGNLTASLDVEKGGARVAWVRGLAVPGPGLLCLVGPSGAGKSSLARAMAMIDPDTKGDVGIDGRVYRMPASQELRNRPRRAVSFVGQAAYLWPHLTISQAAKLVLREHNVSWRSAEQYSRQLDIAGLLDRLPYMLSGGERQRAALLLTLLTESVYLILDEITSNLDTWNRKRVVDLVADMSQQRGILLVTHDIYVVSNLLERVSGARFAFMLNGAIEVQGENSDWRSPNNTDLMAFISAASLSESPK